MSKAQEADYALAKKIINTHRYLPQENRCSCSCWINDEIAMRWHLVNMTIVMTDRRSGSGVWGEES